MSKMTVTTTLNRIRAHGPCHEGWTKLLKHLGKTQADDEPLDFVTILESNGPDDMLWCCRAEPQHARLWRLMAFRFAREVQHLMTDPRSVAALDVAERHANGLATDDELSAAEAAARAAAEAATRAAAGAAEAAAEAAAWAARDAAWAAAEDAAWAARDAAWAARDAAWAARDTAWAAAEAAAWAAARAAAEAAAWDAARDAARARQAEIIREMLGSTQAGGRTVKHWHQLPHRCDTCGRFITLGPGVSWAQTWSYCMDGSPDIHDPVYRCSPCSDKAGIPDTNCHPPSSYHGRFGEVQEAGR